MAQASRTERKIRRLKIDLKRALKMAEIALIERNQARYIASVLEKELERRDGVDVSTPKGGLTITRPEEDIPSVPEGSTVPEGE